MNSNYAKATLLFAYLWLPSLAALVTNQVESFEEAIAVICFSLFVLLSPLLLFHRIRHFFIFWIPFTPLILPYAYLTFFYHSVPSDAIVASAIHQDFARTLEILWSFGWKILLIPASSVAYFLLARSVGKDFRISNLARKKLLASLLMFVMVSMVSRQALALTVQVPPFLEDYTATLTFPSNLFHSISRSLGRNEDSASHGSVHGYALDNTQQLIVVLVIGESVRADHLGINGYNRNTTPMLSALGQSLISFSDVASTANYTLAAVPRLVTFPTKEGQVSLVQTFKEAGFNTAWLSNQESAWYGNSADVLDYSTSTFDFHLRKDVSLLPLFESFTLQGGAKQFVVLHMNGSHAPYDERYSANSLVFRPILKDVGVSEGPSLEDKAEAINSYDNTIVEMDTFLSKVISILSSESAPAIMLYTSDHGENLYDDKRGLSFHAQPEPTRYDTHVPLLIWTNSAYQRAFSSTVSTLHVNKDRKISHSNIFPTLLALGRVGWDHQSPRKDFASPQFNEVTRMTRGGDGIDREYDLLK